MLKISKQFKLSNQQTYPINLKKQNWIYSFRDTNTDTETILNCIINGKNSHVGLSFTHKVVILASNSIHMLLWVIYDMAQRNESIVARARHRSPSFTVIVKDGLRCRVFAIMDTFRWDTWGTLYETWNNNNNKTTLTTTVIDFYVLH